jgi:hypothetical protein
MVMKDKSAATAKRFSDWKPADVFLRRGGLNGRVPLTHLRFATAAEAISYIIDEPPARFQASVVLEVDEERFDYDDIRDLSARIGGTPGRPKSPVS